MPATVVVGTQWGDEGKGKLTDLLAAEMDMVVRYQGGHNAGHRIVVDGEAFALQRQMCIRDRAKPSPCNSSLLAFSIRTSPLSLATVLLLIPRYC